MQGNSTPGWIKFSAPVEKLKLRYAGMAAQPGKEGSFRYAWQADVALTRLPPAGIWPGA